MRSSRTSLAILVSTLILVASVVPLPVQATHQTDPWRPYGPHIQQILVSVFGAESAEFAAFENGDLDLTDWPVFASKEPIYAADSNFHLTPGVAEFGFFDVEFNLAQSFWGISFQENRGSDGFDSPSTKQPTQAGLEIRKAFAHLIDKESFIADSSLQGRGERIDSPVPTAQGLVNPDTGPWDSLHPSTVSAYNIAPDPGGFPAVGSLDFRAARDHLLQVRNSQGQQVFFDANNDGIIDNPPQSRLVFYIRSDHPPRLEMGLGLAAAVEALFGGADVVDERPVNIVQATPVVFLTGEPFDWHMYTGGWRLGPFWDHLWALYHSQFASSMCGGAFSDFTVNYIFSCTPLLDQRTSDTIFSTTLAGSSISATSALDTFGRNVVTIPVYSPTSRFVYRAGWTGMIDQVGIGPANTWTLLNGRPDGSRPPAIPDTLRWGFKQGTSRLNMFHSQTLWEFFILNAIYDSMLIQNPRNPLQLIDWMTTGHRTFVNPSSSELGYNPPAGTETSLRFFLRNNLAWHDGTPFTSDDVKFSILSYRDVPSANLAPSVANVVEVTVLNPTVVDVHLIGVSAFHELNIGLIPIIPRHLWDTHGPTVNDPPDGFPDLEKTALTFDAMESGILVGSGPFKCLDLDSGQPGGSCSQTGIGDKGGQSIVDGRFLLTRSDSYMRSLGNFAEFSWADQTNDALVNIVDIAGAALCFDQPATGSCAYWERPSVGIDPTRVDIGEIAAVASRFEETYVSPFLWSQVTDIDAFTP